MFFDFHPYTNNIKYTYKNCSKNNQKSTPNLSKIEAKMASKLTWKIHLQNCSKNGPKMLPKSLQNWSKIGCLKIFGSPNRFHPPKPARNPLGSRFGTDFDSIWVRFWTDFGPILARFETRVNKLRFQNRSSNDFKLL